MAHPAGCSLQLPHSAVAPPSRAAHVWLGSYLCTAAGHRCARHLAVLVVEALLQHVEPT